MADITVGAGKDFATLASAIAASAAGDTILVDAGTYIDDFATINHALTIRGVGGMAHLVANSQPPDGKAILTINVSVTLDHIEFSGTTVPDGNGAGIRYQGGDLVLESCWFHDNQNGLLAAPVADGTISITRCEFNDNGAGDGRTHNLYVNEIARLSITESYFHGVLVGHEIKSRARETIITNNRIADGPDSTASYSIDLPDGGLATITGNVFEKGVQAQNRTFIHLGGERNPSYDNTSLLVQGNLFINSNPGPPVVLRNDSVVGGANAPAGITGNTFHAIAESRVVIGSAMVANNIFATTAPPPIDTSPPFADAVACFLAGTRLATPTGSMAVERLAAGDLVMTASGMARPVRWVGDRRIDCRRHPRPCDALPVRVEADAFGPGQPARDLFLSPDHAVHDGGVLVPVRYLLNGATVTQVDVASARYFHVELADAEGAPVHDIVLVEGLAAESYLDTGNRADFANGGTAVRLHAHQALAVWADRSVAPLVREGATLHALRARLRLRALALGHRTSSDARLVLVVDGREVVPQRVGPWLRFRLPEGACEGVLRSRRFTPAEIDDGSVDHRALGVAVAQLRLDGVPVDLAALARGWHAIEPGFRWTDGAATLPLEGAAVLHLLPGPPGCYWEPAERRRAQAKGA